MRTRPTAVFMAFGTKGDVFPIAAIAAAFASDQHQYYDVAFITHSAHENLGVRLGAKRVAYFPVSSPPVLSPCEDSDTSGSTKVSFSLRKEEITRKQRKECVSIVERIFEESPSLEGDVIIINFFALEGWSLAELFHIRCVVAAPYVVPYSAPSSFERQFRKEFPLLYKYLKEAPADMVGWEDVLHWMWPLFTDDWGLWRSLDLKLSTCPFTDPVTGLPTWHERPSSPLLLYGFSKEIVECPGYWPSRVRVCGFWFLPAEWQFSCFRCADATYLMSSEKLNVQAKLCLAHSKLQHFLDSSPEKPVFISLSSVGSMGFLRNPKTFLRILGDLLAITSCRFILFSAGYEPLDVTIKMFAGKAPSASEQVQSSKDETLLFDGRLLCFSGNIPYNWLFPRCAAAIHHGGSGSTAAALQAGIPQVICPFMLDQFYWAERMFWLGVAPEPLNSNQLLPDRDDDCYIKEAANMLARVLNSALSSKVKLRASELAKRISDEDGVSEAVRIIKEEITRKG
ncbi:sterol 3-beta-glucosyltransferase UGT80A2 isoform X1 [Olea europaea var. sylvestris]|uniref:sterol 3-beta-glucosyltransferase UGT80A2 isoform X1 n=1 Tax=Olea europaea var. sylvestris TaxID=158386 RepID=UPI000C1D33E9|nr:sterol 3-beta-glucosyltransferase UGT80A2 isoform X1 [Olea europaea var. sylvestris]